MSDPDLTPRVGYRCSFCGRWFTGPDCYHCRNHPNWTGQQGRPAAPPMDAHGSPEAPAEAADEQALRDAYDEGHADGRKLHRPELGAAELKRSARVLRRQVAALTRDIADLEAATDPSRNDVWALALAEARGRHSGLLTALTHLSYVATALDVVVGPLETCDLLRPPQRNVAGVPPRPQECSVCLMRWNVAPGVDPLAACPACGARAVCGVCDPDSPVAGCTACPPRGAVL